MRYHFFLHYGWFFQNLGKEAVRTFMHTTVYPNARGRCELPVTELLIAKWSVGWPEWCKYTLELHFFGILNSEDLESYTIPQKQFASR